MPPKPKGLKASAKRAAPTETPAPAGPALNAEKTMPLDEDALTLADLFELRANVLEILYPLPTSLTPGDTDFDRADDARNLLRGILHGCAVLEPFVEEWDAGSYRTDDKDGPRSYKEVKKRRQEAGEDKLEALGVGANGSITEGQLLFLQGFALHYLGALFEPSDDALKPSAVKNAQGTKKRKVDLREPQTREGWLEAAHERLQLLVDGVMEHNDWHDMDGEDIQEESSRMTLNSLFEGEYAHCTVDLADALFAAGRAEDAMNLISSPSSRWNSRPGFIFLLDHPLVSQDDAVLAWLRAYSACVPLAERHPEETGGANALRRIMENLDRIRAVLQQPAGVELPAKKDGEDDDEEEEDDNVREHPWACMSDESREREPFWRFLMDVVEADCLASQFILLEDAVEAKYRPDAGDEAEDEEDAEVTPLPLDADEVKQAKEASEKALDALRKTIATLASLPSALAHPSAKLAQYRKLEEVLLVSSALINPDETDALRANEEEVAKVRKEGGLDELDGEDGDEGDAGGAKDEEE
ncbi:Proteophosphoglycan ppg4 [Rhodotorula toruloides ATCC 204091]|uniref:Proteophosphoglycan ppg4 n=1 Tax=Rhodotorula toruloides TaxID=5286 RepID=A0A0K3CKM2_RHOTO|nr:Proteophosphoglycan ppg4 [Rhodotorula toruloides ATCC 204091]PRQ73527.1 Proteophosphoglycan ppg4 [Rhodotorula toruloides]